MEPMADSTITPSAQRLQVLTRTLRHEVGDLLQTVYATVAILQERLPPSQALERRILADLRVRAEVCKNELDAVHDLVCPLQLSLAPFDLAELCGSLAALYSRRYPQLDVRSHTAGPVPIKADGRRLNQVAQLLLSAACPMARKEVVLRAGPGRGTGTVEWLIEDDGPGATAEQLTWMDEPFTTTHHALIGLGLALGRRVADAHGGRIEANNRAEGGFRIRVTLPGLESTKGADTS
jgi:signal transduction histidine kinase